MRLAVLVSRFPAVSETFVLQQVEGLVRRGHDVRVFARRPGDGADLLDPSRRTSLEERTTWFDRDDVSRGGRLASAARALAALALAGPGRALRLAALACADADPLLAPAVRLARELARHDGFDAVLCHFGPNGRLAALLDEAGLLGVPFATVFHGYDLTAHLRGRGDDYYALLLARGAAFLPVSERFAGVLRGLGSPDDRIRVHHMGIDGAQLAWGEPAAVEGPVRLLSIARLVEKKGVRFAIEALARLARDGVAAHYTVVGDGPLRTEIEALARDLGVADRLEVTGWAGREEVLARLRESHVLLAPSVTAGSGDEEGIPVVLMEAMACGVPVVATRHGGIAELVQHDVSGLLVDERAGPALAAAVARLVAEDGLRVRLSRAARKTVEEEFERTALDDRLVAILAGLGRKSAPGDSR